MNPGSRVKIKVCGLTRPEDLDCAVSLGADYAGFIFYPPSPRYITPQRAAEICDLPGPAGRTYQKVGVFVNEYIEIVRDIYHRVGLDIVQLHGDEDPGYVERLGLPCWKAVRVKDRESLRVLADYPCDTFLLDTYVKGTYGGTGKTFDPRLAEALLGTGKKGTGKKIIISGGISSENLQRLFQLPQLPYAVDVNSTLESQPGVKDRKKLEQFFYTFASGEHHAGAP